ncbi:hypothetical protein JOM56_012858 [Amanita muscaria]
MRKKRKKRRSGSITGITLNPSKVEVPKQSELPPLLAVIGHDGGLYSNVTPYLRAFSEAVLDQFATLSHPQQFQFAKLLVSTFSEVFHLILSIVDEGATLTAHLTMKQHWKGQTLSPRPTRRGPWPPGQGPWTLEPYSGPEPPIAHSGPPAPPITAPRVQTPFIPIEYSHHLPSATELFDLHAHQGPDHTGLYLDSKKVIVGDDIRQRYEKPHYLLIAGLIPQYASVLGLPGGLQGPVTDTLCTLADVISTCFYDILDDQDEPDTDDAHELQPWVRNDLDIHIVKHYPHYRLKFVADTLTEMFSIVLAGSPIAIRITYRDNDSSKDLRKRKGRPPPLWDTSHTPLRDPATETPCIWDINQCALYLRYWEAWLPTLVEQSLRALILPLCALSMSSFVDAPKRKTDPLDLLLCIVTYSLRYLQLNDPTGVAPNGYNLV